MSGTAIVLINHKKCIIENNTMKNVGCAIDFKYMTDYENANFHVPNSGYAGIKDRLDDNANRCGYILLSRTVCDTNIRQGA